MSNFGLYDLFPGLDEFLDIVFTRLNHDLKIQTKSYICDHICFRVETDDEYLKMKSNLSAFGSLFLETKIGGRNISTFLLRDPIQYTSKDNTTYLIECVELPSPKESSFYHSGLEHVEFSIGYPSNLTNNFPDDFSRDKYIAQNPDFGSFISSVDLSHRSSDRPVFDLRAVNKSINADISLDLILPGTANHKFGKGGVSVKFHHLPLRRVIEIEIGSQVHEFVG